MTDLLAGVHASRDRTTRLAADVERLAAEATPTDRDRLLGRLGAGAMAAGVAVTVVAYALSHGTDNPLAQRDAIVVALVGVSLSVVGGAVYLLHGLKRFLRLWLARLIYENAVAHAGGAPPGSPRARTEVADEAGGAA